MGFLDRMLSRKAQRPSDVDPADSQPSAAGLVERGEALLAQREFAAALAVFEEALSADSDNAVAHKGRGNALMGLQRVAEAAAAYSQALAIEPDYIAALFNYGNALLASGRSAEALETYQKGLALQPQDAGMHNALGNVYAARGDFAAALRAYREAVQLAPEQPDYRYNCGYSLFSLGQAQQAVEMLVEALRTRPDYAEAHHLLALALLQTQRITEADAALVEFVEYADDKLAAAVRSVNALVDHGFADRALQFAQQMLASASDLARTPFYWPRGLAYVALGRQLDGLADLERAAAHLPDSAPLHLERARALLELGRHAKAAEAFRRCIALTPNDVYAHTGLGVALAYTDPDAGLAALDQAFELDPSQPTALIQKASLLERLNRLDAAEKTLETGLAVAPTNQELLLTKARVLQRRKQSEPAYELLTRVNPAQLTDLNAQIDYWFLSGQVRHACGEYSAALQAFEKGNDLAAEGPKGRPINRTNFPSYIDFCTRTFTPEWIAQWSPTPPLEDANPPIFIVGFPRSGTTLLDQIMDSHPALQTMEEPQIIRRVVLNYLKENGTPGDLSQLSSLSAAAIATLRRRYYAKAAELVSLQPGCFLVDKQPLNLLQLGMIHRLFPTARIVFALRHPYDVVLSCFMQNFELNDSMIQFTSIDSSARFYAKVMGLGAHYRSLLPLSIYTIRYEDVVQDMAGEITKLIEFLGLPWDEAILRYRQTASEKNIRTPSYAAVVEGIYSHARYRWHHYREALAPVAPILEPWIEAFGYQGMEHPEE